MLKTSKRTCMADAPIYITGNEKIHRKIEYRNSYTAYLNIHNAIPMGCLIMLELLLCTELHILTNSYFFNVFCISAFFCMAESLIGFKLFNLENSLRNCGDNRSLTYRLGKNGRGKEKIYV